VTGATTGRKIGTALLFIPEMPRPLGILAIGLALVGAVKFTGWYPEQVRSLQRS